MPNPVPLATKEEEERRAWVTHHHEVVRLIKDCFGDRFSNNEIFDRLKISRRTGYRALGNDERIGKAPGRKPKIMDSTIREMIEYIEAGGCKDVGNVWKHLAERFAPDCNPKTVQDSVKKSGFTNYHSMICVQSSEQQISDTTYAIDQVRLEPLLNEQVPENQPAPVEEEAAAVARELEHERAQQIDPSMQQDQGQRQAQNEPTPQSAIDPVFQQQHGAQEGLLIQNLRLALPSAPDENIRYLIHELLGQMPETAHFMQPYLIPAAHASNPRPAQPSHAAPAVAQMTASAQAISDSPLRQIQSHGPGGSISVIGQKRRLAVCRRCERQYDRSINTMGTRECLYHKGSPQKINPAPTGTIEENPEAYIWSCCGGNGVVRGCCRAMHTTKKKRKYSKKRDAETAELDDEDGAAQSPDNEDDTSMLENTHMPTQMGATVNATGGDQPMSDPNIDSSLQDLPPEHMTGADFSQLAAQLAESGANHSHVQVHREAQFEQTGDDGSVSQLKAEAAAAANAEMGTQLRIVQAQTQNGLGDAAGSS